MQVFKVLSGGSEGAYQSTFKFDASGYEKYSYMSLVQCKMTNIFDPSGILYINNGTTTY